MDFAFLTFPPAFAWPREMEAIDQALTQLMHVYLQE
jgi:hypothetical protein